MDTYGTTSQGKFVIQQVDTLPMFGKYDVGRMILVKDEGNYYLGGIRGWLGVAGNGFIKAHQLDIGNGINQINGNTIPIRNILGYFQDSDTIDDVLEKLADGQYIQPKAIQTKHYDFRSITQDKIKFGTTSTDIGAQTIPYYHVIDKDNTTVSEVLDYILKEYPTILNKNIDINHWEFDTTTGLFYCTIYYKTIRDKYPVITLYDQYGSVFIPSKLVYEKKSNKIMIYVAYKMYVTVSIVG